MQTLLERLAPALPRLAARTGKAALAKAPTLPLPAAIVARAKTGFTVPTGTWMNAAIGKSGIAARRGRPLEAKGVTSRRWSQAVLHGFA